MRVLPALFLFIAVPIGAQTHCDVHYRWQEKTDKTGHETGNDSTANKKPHRRNDDEACSYRVGAPGFEPGTSCSQSRRDTGLRYAPK